MSPVSGSTLSRIAGSIKTEIQGINVWLGGGFKYFYFHPIPGEDSHFDQYFFKGVGSTTTQMVYYPLNKSRKRREFRVPWIQGG